MPRGRIEFIVRIRHFVLDAGAEVGRTRILPQNFLASDLRLVIGQRPDAAQGLEQADEIQVRDVGMHHLAIQRNFLGVLEVDDVPIEEREADLEARRRHDDVVLGLATIRKRHRLPFPRRDARFRDHAAMTDDVQQVRIHGRMVTQHRFRVHRESDFPVRALQDA